METGLTNDEGTASAQYAGMEDHDGLGPAPVEMHGRRVWIGCWGMCTWHWRGPFYPADLPQKKWLDFYVRHFPTVELNNTFYILPAASTFESWRDNAPEGFLYAVKASRFITHMKKLSDPQPHLARLFERACLLGDKLGPCSTSCPLAGASMPSASRRSSRRCQKTFSKQWKCVTRAG